MTEDGTLTDGEISAVVFYARLWLQASQRDLRVERNFPQLTALLLDLRNDRALAMRYAEPSTKQDNT